MGGVHGVHDVGPLRGSLSWEAKLGGHFVAVEVESLSWPLRGGKDIRREFSFD